MVFISQYHFVALRRTPSSISISFVKYELHTCIQYSKLIFIKVVNEWINCVAVVSSADTSSDDIYQSHQRTHGKGKFNL